VAFLLLDVAFVATGALAVAQGDGLAGTSITNTAGTDNGSSRAWMGTQISSGAAGDATATSGSRTRAIATPVANIAVGTGYASATGDAPSADASTSRSRPMWCSNGIILACSANDDI
jgi:hypothetical protein